MCLRLLFGHESRCLSEKRIFERIILIQSIGYNVHLLNGVGDAVNPEVQAHIEEMLVIRCIKQRCNHRAMLRMFAFVNSAQR